MFLFPKFLANVNNVRTNTKGMSINMDKLADSVLSMEEKQDQTAKSIELIHILVSNIGEIVIGGRMRSILAD